MSRADRKVTIPVSLLFFLGAWPCCFTLSYGGEAESNQRAATGVSLFDTAASTQARSAEDLGRKAGWVLVPEDKTDYAFRGDAVIQNERLAVVLRRGGSGAEVYGHGTKGFRLRTVLTPADQNGVAGKLASLAIVENTSGEAALDATFEAAGARGLGVRFALAAGQPFVRTESRQGAKAIEIQSPCRFLVLPDFFADDIVIDAQEIPVDSAEVPSENFLLHMLPGRDAIVMSVSGSRDRDALMRLEGRGPDRLVRGSRVWYGKEGKVWVAVIEATGVWHQHAVARADAEKIISLDWSRPFPAQWRVDWRRTDQLTDSWEMVAETSDGRFEHYGLSDYPGRIPATRDRWTTVLGSFRYPCWLDRSGRGHLQPLKGLGHSWSPDRARQVGFQGPVLIYPLKRARSTPLDQFTVVDLVRATLGVGPCQYILDVEGQGSHYNGMATCGARDALGEIYRNHQQKQKRAEIEKTLQQVVVFVKHIRGRIEDYVAFTHDLTSYLDQQQEKHPELAAWIGEIRSLTAKVDEHVAARKESIKTPQYVIDLTDRFRLTVMDYEGADALEKCEAITNAIVEVGGNQDELVGECRMVVKAIRQRAGLALAVEPRASEIAREIRDRSHQVLRNPAGHEGARH